MAEMSVASLKEAIAALKNLTPELADSIRLKEEKTDYYEDILSTYLVKLSALQISSADSMEAAKLLKIIGDYERISDHAVNVLEAAEEMRTRHIRRMQQGGCSITAGFVWSDLLTDLERTADHCSNIAGCMLEIAQQNINLHEHLREFRNGSEAYRRKFRERGFDTPAGRPHIYRG